MSRTIERDGARRRSPIQNRGERRVERILNAAAALLAEVGYDALTLTDVAERSGSAIGSLYHFFSNKDQLVDALVERIAVRLRALPAFVLKPSLVELPIESFVHGLIEPLAAFAGEHPELPELMGRVIERNASLDSEIVERLDSLIRTRATRLATGERQLVVRITIEVVRAGIRLLARSPKSSRKAVIAELETVLASYLRSRIDDAATANPKS